MFRIFLCGVLLILSGLGSLQAREYFVAPAGTDTADGTKAAPFATIQCAEKSAEAGDTVFVRGGT